MPRRRSHSTSLAGGPSSSLRGFAFLSTSHNIRINLCTEMNHAVAYHFLKALQEPSAFWLRRTPVIGPLLSILASSKTIKRHKRCIANPCMASWTPGSSHFFTLSGFCHRVQSFLTALSCLVLSRESGNGSLLRTRQFLPPRVASYRSLERSCYFRLQPAGPGRD